MRKIKLAIVGCGFISDYHKDAFKDLDDQIKVIGCCDIIPERAEKAAKHLKAEHAVEDYRELLNKADAFLLAVPHDQHYPIGMECLKNKKHVLMEKPMALNEAQCLELTHAAIQNGVKFMVGYVMRYHPMIIKLKEIIDSEEHGECFHMSIWTEQYSNVYGFYEREKNGGGQFFNHGCHYVDLLMWYFGNPVKGAHMGTNLGTPWMEAEGTSNCIFEFEGKKLAYHFGTWGARGMKHSYAMHAFFEDCMIECCLNDGKMYLHKKSKIVPYFETCDEQILIFQCAPQIHQPIFELAHFADCIRNHKEPITNGPVSMQSLRVIWRMYEAEEKNVIADLRGISLDGPWDIHGLAKLPE